jgi:hypothetical protein
MRSKDKVEGYEVDPNRDKNQVDGARTRWRGTRTKYRETRDNFRRTGLR